MVVHLDTAKRGGSSFDILLPDPYLLPTKDRRDYNPSILTLAKGTLRISLGIVPFCFASDGLRYIRLLVLLVHFLERSALDNPGQGDLETGPADLQASTAVWKCGTLGEHGREPGLNLIKHCHVRLVHAGL